MLGTSGPTGAHAHAQDHAHDHDHEHDHARAQSRGLIRDHSSPPHARSTSSERCVGSLDAHAHDHDHENDHGIDRLQIARL